jgi:hypothetical protein
VEQTHLPAIEQNGDFITARKLAQLNLAHLKKMGDALNSLSSDDEEDVEKIKAIQKAAEQINELNKRISDFVLRTAYDK